MKPISFIGLSANIIAKQFKKLITFLCWCLLWPRNSHAWPKSVLYSLLYRVLHFIDKMLETIIQCTMLCVCYYYVYKLCSVKTVEFFPPFSRPDYQ